MHIFSGLTGLQSRRFGIWILFHQFRAWM